MSYNDLLLLTLNESPETVVNKYVMNLIKKKHPKDYYPIIKDKAKVALLVEKHKKELKLKASKLSAKTNFTITKNIHYSKFDPDTSKLIIKNFLIGNVMTIPAQKFTNNGMPNNYFLLIPNIEMLNNFNVDSKKFQSLVDNNKFLKNKSLYMEIIVNLIKLQNIENFQTVIKKVNLYESENKEFLLASKTESAPALDLIDDWLLSEGYTTNLIGIHAYSFFGNRLQDPLEIATAIEEFCDKTMKLGIHQVIVCNRPISDNMYLITTYIGGAMGKIDLVAKSALNEGDKKWIIQNLRNNLNKPMSILNKKYSHWSAHHTDFVFYSDAFNYVKSEESKYTYEFGTNDKYQSLDLTLIVSMMAHETKKLIEEHK